MKREKRTTKKERKAAQAVISTSGASRAAKPGAHDHKHIHCIACGKHLDPSSFGEAGGPSFYRCPHGSDFRHCAEHEVVAKQLVDEHDRTGKPVQSVSAWH